VTLCKVKRCNNQYKYENKNGGWGGIRTHDGLAPMPVFKTGAFNRSATHPYIGKLQERLR
tara:strand:+ start:336 stop:515 length:180 start_codon:yes stop_codon:yes gene_type:complete